MGIERKKNIIDIEDQISSDPPLDLKTPEEVLEEKDYQLVKAMFDIVAKYKSPSWIEDMSLTEMTADLLTLQASQVELMYTLGNITSYADNIEEQLKIQRSKVRLKAKGLKTDQEKLGNSVSLTADDIKDISYAKTEDTFKKLEDRRVAANFVKFVYFSIKEHVTMLNYTIQRLSRVEPQ